MTLQQLTSLVLDFLLIIAAIVAYLARPRLGGQLAKGLRILLVGVMVLGFAHLIESVLFALFNVDLMTNEILHRLLVGLGFIFIIAGFITMRRAFFE